MVANAMERKYIREHRESFAALEEQEEKLRELQTERQRLGREYRDQIFGGYYGMTVSYQEI